MARSLALTMMIAVGVFGLATGACSKGGAEAGSGGAGGSAGAAGRQPGTAGGGAGGSAGAIASGGVAGSASGAGGVPLLPAFAETARQIAGTYMAWGRVDDELRWAPGLCRIPLPGVVCPSKSNDPTTHGQKLYSVFAKDRAA